MTANLHSAETRVSALLSNLPLFRELKPEELAHVAAGTRAMQVQRRDLVFRKGDACTGFHLVVFGRVKLFFPLPDGGEKAVEIIEPGSSFGEAVMFLEKPYVVSARALADSLLLHVARAAVVDEMRANPGFGLRIIAGLSYRLHGLIRDFESSALGSGTQRLIGYLLRVDTEPDLVRGQSSVILPAAKSVIASRLNLTPEYFSRVLQNLSRSGLIRVKGREIHILDVERLKAFGSTDGPGSKQELAH